MLLTLGKRAVEYEKLLLVVRAGAWGDVRSLVLVLLPSHPSFLAYLLERKEACCASVYM